MSTVIPFPTQVLDQALDDDDQRQALRAMLRYLHREMSDSNLPTTAAAIALAMQALDHEWPE
ncbi:hypothetical protein [Caenispirillum salinarum]|uniref:hypothetical protein n=1 Tax=Caenispirillum salinarum TaxID=859058 RepID=UPI00384EA048